MSQFSHATKLLCIALLAVVLAVGMSACGSDHSDSAQPVSVSKSIGAAQGGDVTISPGTNGSTGATVHVPPNALASDATVTLTDSGPPKQGSDDPLLSISHIFIVTTKGQSGSPVSFKIPLILTIKPDQGAIQNALKNAVKDAGADASDILVAQVVSDDAKQPCLGALSSGLSLFGSMSGTSPCDDTGVVHLQDGASILGGLLGTGSQANPARTAPLTASAAGSVHIARTPVPDPNMPYPFPGIKMWLIYMPHLPLPSPTPAQQPSLLQVPWYYRGSLPWNMQTAITDMMRFYDFSPDVGDPLLATFGGSQALANWQLSGKTGEPANQSGTYKELFDMGVPNLTGNPNAGTKGLQILGWDDADGDFYLPASDPKSSFPQFQNWVREVTNDSPGKPNRRPIMLTVDKWQNTVVIVGADASSIYLHDPSGSMAKKYSWGDFQTLAHGWSTGQHAVFAAVAYGYSIRAEAQRTGSIVTIPNDITTTDTLGNLMGIDWDGAQPHSHGYFFNNPSNTGPSQSNDLGHAAANGIPLKYQYRIANVTGLPLTYKSVAELSTADNGTSLGSQSSTTTVPAYSLSDVITGAFNQPEGKSEVAFDVKLFEASNASPDKLQDVKFLRYSLHDPTGPTVKITNPANGAHVNVNTTVQLTSTSSDPESGKPLPDANLTWKVDGNTLGTGGGHGYSWASAGSHTITLTGVNAAGKSASDSVTITVDQAASSASVKIIAPLDGTVIDSAYNTKVLVNFTGQGSAGLTLNWKSSIDGNIATGATARAYLTVQNAGNCATPTKHIITLEGNDGTGRVAATASITISLRPSCVR